MLKKNKSVAGELKTRPSDVSHMLFCPSRQKTRIEEVATKILGLSLFKNKNRWEVFTWEEYREYHSDMPPLGELVILNGLADLGFLIKDAQGAFHFTRKMILEYRNYTKKEQL